jgi:small subunit ribosomal protein S18
MFRRKRTLDPSIVIDYKQPDVLRRFVTDRGKIIPRRISGATAKQQRAICKAVKRARYLGLLPYSLAHRQERNFATEMAAIATSAIGTTRRMNRPDSRGGDNRGDSRGSDNRSERQQEPARQQGEEA